MKNILIITSHFPPSNLTCVHRSRYLSKYLSNHGWNPIIVTTKEKYYSKLIKTKFLEYLFHDKFMTIMDWIKGAAVDGDGSLFLHLPFLLSSL